MNHQDAFKDLFRNCYPQLFAFAMTIVKDEETCRDILSDSFENLWNHLEAISVESQRSYVYRVVRNYCVDWTRKQATRHRYEAFVRVVGDETDTDGALLMEADERIEQIYRLLDTLSPETRTILDRCYFQGQRQAQVAEEMGISVSTVKKHVHKALSVIRAQTKRNEG